MQNHSFFEEIVSTFEIETRRPPADEAELLHVLARQIEAMFETRPDFLFSLLYRNDISEKTIVAALDPSALEAGHIGLARAVLERQKARLLAKKNFQPPKPRISKIFNGEFPRPSPSGRRRLK